MSISSSANSARLHFTATSGQTAFSVSFEFFDNADLDVYVNGTQKTITTHYSVSGGDGSTGTVTFNSGLTLNDAVTITRRIDIERVTDFSAGQAINRAALNTQLDTLTAISSDNKDRAERSLRAPDDENAPTMTLPSLTSRKGTVLGFNATSGNVEAGPKIADVSTLAAVTADIATLADIEDGTDATDAIQTVAGIASNVSTVAGVSSAVSTVAGISSNVTAVAADATDIGAVAGKATEIGRLGTSDAVADLAILGTSDAVSDMNTLAAISSNISTVAGISANVTSVAGVASLITSDFVADLNTLATTDIVSDLNTLATADIVSDLNTLATSDIVSDLNTLATADIVSDLNTLATTDIVSDLNTLATTDIVTDLNLLATSAIVEDLNLLATSTVIADMATLAGAGANPNISSLGVSGNITLADNGKAIFGAGSDLQIYHDGSRSIIQDNGTGNLRIQANNLELNNADNSENYLFAANNGAVTLYYNNAEKLNTTSTGVDITGTLISDGLTVDGDVRFTSSDTTDQFIIENTNTGSSSAPDMVLYRNSTSPADGDVIGRIDYRGKDDGALDRDYITLYSKIADASTGSAGGSFHIQTRTGATTADRFVISGSGNVGIGTSSPSRLAELYGTSNPALRLNNGTDVADIGLASSAGALLTGSTSGALVLSRAGANAINLGTNGQNRVTIDSSGSVGIGTDSPVYPLVVQAANPRLQLLGTGTNTGISGLLFGDADTATRGQINYNHPSDSLDIVVNATERMRITSDGSVGIGTSSPSSTLAVETGGIASLSSYAGHIVVGPSTRTSSSGDYSGGILFDQANGVQASGKKGASIVGFQDGSDVNSMGLTFNVHGTDGSANREEAMRIDTSGRLLVGKTAQSLSTAGFEVEQSGQASFTQSGASCIRLNRLSSDGDIIQLRKDGSTVGTIGIKARTSSGRIFVGNSNTRLLFDNGVDAIIPANNDGNDRDNAIDLGASGARFDDIYATNGTIQTSDRNEKQDIAELSDAEQRVAVAAKGLMRKFRWRDAVEAKGDQARTHFGIIAQDLQAAFAAEGLDAGDYAMFISSTWTDENTGEERTRMGVRYSELLAFIIAAI